jgi:hypothetical protein
MQLFFGYIENYSIMTLGILIYAYLGLLRLQDQIALVWPAVALALTNAFHPSTIILTPSLIYLAVAAVPIEQGNIHSVTNVLKRERWRIDVRSVLSVVLPYTLVFAGVIALMSLGEHGLDALMGIDFPGGGDRSWFVPLFEVTTKWQHYTMFSVGHLVDIVNQQLLVAPIVWPSLMLIGLLAWHRIPRGDAIGWFLLLMASCYLLLILVWNAVMEAEGLGSILTGGCAGCAAASVGVAAGTGRKACAGCRCGCDHHEPRISSGRMGLAEYVHSLSRNQFRNIHTVYYLLSFLDWSKLILQYRWQHVRETAKRLGQGGYYVGITS